MMNTARLFRTSLHKFLAPGTHRRARETYLAVGRLGAHMLRHIRHGRELSAYCSGRSNLLLNIGCGELIHPEWVNIDYTPRRGKSFYFDALDPLPIAAGSVRHIHCEHFLEHLEFDDAVQFLAECYRVLQSRGTMRIIVPDAERYMRAYCDNDREFFEKLVDLGCPSQPLIPKVRVLNQSFRMGDAHRFAWDFETLESVVRSLNFQSISRSAFNHVESEFRIDGDDWLRPIESLYVNMEK